MSEKEKNTKILDRIDINVQKLAARLGAIATLIGVVTGGGAWLLNQIDNKLSSHIETQTSAIQQEVEELSKQSDEQDKGMSLQLTRLELLALISHDPENVVEIEKVAHNYFSSGGNSYMTSIYSKWAKQYGGDLDIVLE